MSTDDDIANEIEDNAIIAGVVKGLFPSVGNAFGATMGLKQALADNGLKIVKDKNVKQKATKSKKVA